MAGSITEPRVRSTCGLALSLRRDEGVSHAHLGWCRRIRLSQKGCGLAALEGCLGIHWVGGADLRRREGKQRSPLSPQHPSAWAWLLQAFREHVLASWRLFESKKEARRESRREEERG